jgi:hypothetical protein
MKGRKGPDTRVFGDMLMEHYIDLVCSLCSRRTTKWWQKIGFIHSYPLFACTDLPRSSARPVSYVLNMDDLWCTYIQGMFRNQGG